MTKNEVVSSLQDARTAHKKWVGFGKSLLDGVDVSSVQPPVKCTECLFGQWFYSEREHIKNIPGFKEIESLHEEFHRKYEILYQAAPKAQRPKGFLMSKSEYQRQIKIFAEQYNDLETKSVKLIGKLEMVEQIVGTMSDRLFERNRTQKPKRSIRELTAAKA